MSEPNDPRVFFASERTLLAWVRTGVSVIGLGFVVAKFGMFLEEHGGAVADPSAYLRSLSIGVLLVLLGGLATAHAAWHHRRLCQTLSPAQLPPVYTFRIAVWFGMTLAAISLLLAGHLLLRTERVMEKEKPAPPKAPHADSPN